MDYKRFIAELPSLYNNWGQASIQPKDDLFQKALTPIEAMTTPNVTQLLNFAVACLEAGEVYCEVGCFRGGTLIGALLNHPHCLAYAVDNFSEFDPSGENQKCLLQNLAAFDMEDQVFFCNQDFEAFFADLRELQTGDRIGVYLYDGAHDYRSQLMGLLLAKPFLAERALIIVDDSNWDGVQQANWDFIASHPQCDLLLDLPTPENGHPSFWNGLQILSWDAQASHHYDWSTLSQQRKEGLIRAIYNLPALSQSTTVSSLEQLQQEAEQLQQAGQLAEAVQRYLEILQQNARREHAWYGLGVAYYQMERYGDAVTAFTHAIEINGSVARYYYGLGLGLEKTEQIPAIAHAYQQAIALDPTMMEARNRFGNLVAEHGDPQQAELIYREAIAVNPNFVDSYFNLGNILLIQGAVERAIAAYEAGLSLEPTNPDLINNLEFAQELAQDESQAHLFAGNSLLQRQRYQEAANHFEHLVQTQKADLPIFAALAECYEQLKQYAAVITICQQAIVHNPNASFLHMQLIRALREANQTEAAIAQATHAAQRFPDEPYFQFQQHLLLPVLYQTEADIAAYRHRFTQGLAALTQQIAPKTAPLPLLSALNQHINFLLAYQNGNDVELQRQYGQFAHQIMAANFPDWVKPLPMPPVTDQIRIGYVSGCLWEHTIGKLMIGWLRHHNQQTFRIACYSLSEQADSFTAAFRQFSDVFHPFSGDLATTAQTILEDHLHLLVFLDVGMQPLMTQLAALRLAPIQCTTWAHPVTSGLPTMDYFLSSDRMEPENAQQHYSEKLIRLPNIGISFAKPVVPPPSKTRADFGLRDDAVVYLTSQLLCKYLPQQDRIFAAIAQQVPHAQFAFVARPNLLVAEQFQQRFKRAFAEFGLDSQAHCVMLPPLSQADYWSLNQRSDVFLDSFGWSGGHTTLEAIACDLPIVTCPGEFMRGRHSYAILQMIGVTDTIATNEAEYINIAVRLGIDPTWRNQIVAKMGDRHPYLYDDQTGIAALETFYQDVVRTL